MIMDAHIIYSCGHAQLAALEPTERSMFDRLLADGTEVVIESPERCACCSRAESAA